jgi:hypothetical protein
VDRDRTELHSVALAAKNCPGKALGLAVVKTFEKMPAVVDNVKHTLADEKGSVVCKSIGFLVCEKLIFGFKKLYNARFVKVWGHFLKSKNVGKIAHINITHMQVAIVNGTAPNIVRHNSEFCFL